MQQTRSRDRTKPCRVSPAAAGSFPDRNPSCPSRTTRRSWSPGRTTHFQITERNFSSRRFRNMLTSLRVMSLLESRTRFCWSMPINPTMEFGSVFTEILTFSRGRSKPGPAEKEIYGWRLSEMSTGDGGSEAWGGVDRTHLIFEYFLQIETEPVGDDLAVVTCEVNDYPD